MEKENAKKTTGEENAQASAGETQHKSLCQSCCGGMDISGDKANKMKDFCKEMPDPEKIEKMMKMFFQGSQKTEQPKA
jgi:hypothetical protein